MEMVNRIILVAPPGMGKTTTVLQLAEYALGVGAVVPIYIHLGDWSAGSVGLLQDVLGRPAFRSFKENQLISLARDGRLLLLLDGWNELDLASQKRLRIEITTLCQAPLNMQFVVTTRLQAAEVPMNGMKIGLNQLSEDQQMELARAQLYLAISADPRWRRSFMDAAACCGIWPRHSLISGAAYRCTGMFGRGQRLCNVRRGRASAARFGTTI